ncbi:MAG: nucleotidyltransferase family protein [Candidatus Eremiobacteraeota bacterium]|nr:nucleotidyltransferase family protein [Candidatus Eremiobacteraeota bacterium]
MFDTARVRRRFYLDRSLRKTPIGAGSDLEALMRIPPKAISVPLGDILRGIPWCVIGGVATRAYMPERATKDIDVLIAHADAAKSEAALEAAGWTRGRELFFPNASLGLYGSAWNNAGAQLDMLSSAQPWVSEALRAPHYDETGLRVIPLAYLVLMKIDSARTIDQGDLGRMLGRVSNAELEQIANVIMKFSFDPQAADDVRQYAQIGRWELQTPSDG